MRAVFGLFLVGLSYVSLGPCHGQGMEPIAQTRLIGLSFDGLNSSIVRQAATQVYELSDGRIADVAVWYAPRFPNITAVFSTDMGRGAALIWGGSLGESGPKYALSPSAVIGFALRQPIGRRATFNLQIYGQYGGALRESTCLGDYGAIGGVQQVNCRMAASILPPAQTLGYLWDIPPSLHTTVKLTYVFRF